VQHRPVANPGSRVGSGRIDQGLHLGGREIGDESDLTALERNRKDAANLLERGRLAVLQKPEEGPDRCQADIARRRAVVPGRVELLEERADQVCVQLLQRPPQTPAAWSKRLYRK
jgi:hypothetical protein